MFNFGWKKTLVLACQSVLCYGVFMKERSHFRMGITDVVTHSIPKSCISVLFKQIQLQIFLLR